MTKSSCLIPCRGLYADIEHHTENATVESNDEGYEKIFKDYELYKRGFHSEYPYPTYFSDYKLRQKLHYVNIYFRSPTYDNIVKDQKANFETKLSMVGGTMGLFAGFSIMSSIEIAYFAAKMMIDLGRKFKLMFTKTKC